MSRHDSHQGAAIDRSTGRSSARARANAAESQESHWTVSTIYRSIIMTGMLVLRFATVLAIAVWIGGLLVLGAIAAPAIFDVVALRQVPDARLLSGAIFGEVLRRFHLVSYGCAAIILIALSIRAVLGPRPRRFSTRFALTLLMLGGALYSGMVLSSRIAQVQREIGVGVAPSSLPAGDPRRVAFGRLHGQSTLVQLVPIVGGLVLMLFELRD